MNATWGPPYACCASLTTASHKSTLSEMYVVVFKEDDDDDTGGGSVPPFFPLPRPVPKMPHITDILPQSRGHKGGLALVSYLWAQLLKQIMLSGFMHHAAQRFSS